MKHFNRLLAAVLALALAIAGVLLVIEVISELTRSKIAIVHWHSWYQWAQRTQWKQGSVRVSSILLAVVGAILLLVELKPRRPSRFSITSDLTDAAYTRRGIAATVRSAVSDVEGVNASKVKVSRHKVTVAATSGATLPAAAQALREPVTAAAQQRLQALELKSTPRLAVRVNPRSS